MKNQGTCAAEEAEKQTPAHQICAYFRRNGRLGRKSRGKFKNLPDVDRDAPLSIFPWISLKSSSATIIPASAHNNPARKIHQEAVPLLYFLGLRD
jgi:hypothetical protein